MKWKQEYSALTNYIANHAEIVINPTEISIPQVFRDEFYRRFDDLRREVVDAHSASLTVDYDSLCDNYLRIEKELVGMLGLEGISMPVDLHTFVHNPKDGLMRILYTRAFDLLQGKITVEAFEEQSGIELRFVATELFRLGYEQWAALVLIKLLDPDEGFFVDLDEDSSPCLAELKTIAFGRQAHHPTLRIPEFVLHSRRLNKYVAVKMVLEREIETFVQPFKPPVRPKKKTGDTSFALDSRAMLLSFMDTPKDIPIIADIYELKRTRPDWMMEYISGSELADPAALEHVNQNMRALNPRLGISLVIVGGGTDARPEGLLDGIRPISVGFDQSRLQSVIDTFPVG